MGIRVALHHKTFYRYDRPVALSPQIVRFRPAPHGRTLVTSYSWRVEPTVRNENFVSDCVFWELVIRDVPRAGRSRDNFG
jgi:transglutaminase-like putative cysteine protease